MAEEQKSASETTTTPAPAAPEPSATEFVDDFAIDVGDIPTPDVVEHKDVDDAFNYPTAHKFAFVGVGQGGSRLAETFYHLGYRRVCAINTTEKDLTHINIPVENKLVIPTESGFGEGAGKNPAVAEEAVSKMTEEVYDLLKRCWGERYDWAFTCLGVGGGTGAGASFAVAEIGKRVMTDMKLQPRMGAVAALPKNDEGHTVAKNAIATVRKLQSCDHSPVVIIDNERIKQIYPKTPVGQFWQTANKGVCTLLHLFNRISAQSSQHTTFDPADFSVILKSGVVAFGAAPITSYTSQADISKSIRQQLQANVLASIDLTQGTHAGLIFVGGKSVLDSMPMEYLDHGFEMLNRMLAEGSMVHRGVYVGSTPDLRVFTMIGGLPYPASRLNELSRIAGESNDYAGG